MPQAAVSQRYLKLIDSLSAAKTAFEGSPMFKAAAAASDAAMIAGEGQAAGAPGMPTENLSDELRARAQDETIPPDVRQLMLENADRLEMVNAPPQAAPPEAAPQAGMPPEAAPPEGIPSGAMQNAAAGGAVPKTAATQFDPDDFAEVVDPKTKNATNLRDDADSERPPTWDGFRSMLSQYS